MIIWNFPSETMSIRHMKLFNLIILCFLVGCAARPPLAELEAEAEETGDWSKVDQYHRMNKSMNRVDGTQPCKNGYVLHCRKKGVNETCTCVSPLNRGILN